MTALRTQDPLQPNGEGIRKTCAMASPARDAESHHLQKQESQATLQAIPPFTWCATLSGRNVLNQQCADFLGRPKNQSPAFGFPSSAFSIPEAELPAHQSP
jgi:hypothetical protein